MLQSSSSLFADKNHTPGKSLWFWPLATAAVWVLFAAWINTGQFGDNIEQFNWSHSLEWGYHKHPPLTTWLLGLLVRLVGQSPYDTYFLGFVCLAATGALTHDIARHLFGLRVANIAIVLWSLQVPFSWRAQLYNHNTLLVLTVALTVWCVLRATSSNKSLPWWLVCGFAAGLSLLAKYQAVVPLTGVLIALLMQGKLKQPEHRLGVLLAALIATIVISPHLSWLISHDFQTLAYASSHDQRISATSRPVSLVSFFLNQLRFLIPALIYMAWQLLMRSKRDAQGTELVAKNADRAWMFGLVGFPILVLVLMSLGRGVALQNHWGMQSFQFVSLWLAARLTLNLQPTILAQLLPAIAIHGVSAALYAHAPFATQRHFFDLRFPTQQLVQNVHSTWQAHTQCPLKFVSGDAYAAGLYSAYSGHHPMVMEDHSAVKSPWVPQQALQREGVMYFALKREGLPEAAEIIDSMSVYMDVRDKNAEVVTFYWGMKRPSRHCAPVFAER
jgi:4-amino-4-deoxy-L-arabinose transferase-like glycosyltransferase